MAGIYNSHGRANKYIDWMFFALLVGLIGLVFVSFFRTLPIESTTLAIDWKTIWNSTHDGKVGFGNAQETIGGFYTPPWGVFFLLPFTLLPLRESWGLFSFVSLLILILSVPKKGADRLDFLGILLLVTSFPAIRSLADGNLECLVITGILLSRYALEKQNYPALTLGLLLSSVKFQETWLVLLFALISVVRKWSKGRLIKFYALLTLVVSVSMIFWGKQWLGSMIYVEWEGSFPKIEFIGEMGKGSIIDISLTSSLVRLGMPRYAIWMILFIIFAITFHQAYKTFSKPERDLRYFFTFLIASSTMLSPYVSGNGYFTLFAIGIFPLLRQNYKVGVLLSALAFVPYFVDRTLLYNYQSYYWLLNAFLFWLVGVWTVPRLYHERAQLA